jgi:glycosyltransferase involved in cell wall biosynthesis
MKLLWVINGRLLPVDSGGRIRSTNTLRELVQRHEVTILSFYRGRRRDGWYEAALAEEFRGGRAVWLGNGVRAAVSYRFPNRLTELLAQDFSGNARARRMIGEALRAGGFDAAISDFLFAAPHFPQELPVPGVLHTHNVESQLLESQASLRRRSPLSAVDRLSIGRLRRYEVAQLHRFDHTLATSDEDAELFRQMAPAAHVTVTGTGVDLREFRPAPLPQNASPLIVYTGMMGYPPNVDAVRWFAAEIWPTVVREVPRARFRIVGRDPGADVRELASEAIEVTGRVDSVADHLREASVVVVPLRSGGGTRLKIYEALATGRPMVSTRLGAQGLDVRDGHDIVFAESAPDFAREVVALLQDRERTARLAAAAAETGARNGWSLVADRIDAALEDVTARARPSRA